MKGVFKRGNTYYIDYYLQGARIQKAIGPDKKLAEAVLQKRKLEIREGKYLDIRKTQRVRFEELCDIYLKQHAIPQIKKSWHSDVDTIKVLKRWFEGKHLHEITPLLVNKFKVERRQEVSPATTNRGLACLKCMFNKAKEWGKFNGDNPVTKVKCFKENNQRVRFLEKEEIDTLLANSNEPLRSIIIVALNTGMRKGEILGLKWRDCDFHRGLIRLTNTKNNESRTVPMNDRVKEVLIKVRKHSESPYIFCHKDGKPYGDIKKSFFTACIGAGIIKISKQGKKTIILEPKGTKFRFHDLRHTFASHLVMSGVDLNTTRELLGHKSIAMTIRYSHLSPDAKRRAVDILGQRMTQNTPKNSDNLVISEKSVELSKESALDKSLSAIGI